MVDSLIVRDVILDGFIDCIACDFDFLYYRRVSLQGLTPNLQQELKKKESLYDKLTKILLKP